MPSSAITSMRPKNADPLEQKLKLFKDCCQVSDRRYHLIWNYPKVFVGSESVAKLIETKAVPDEKAALALGKELMDAGYFSHVENQHTFKNEYLFYRFTVDEAEPGFLELVPGVFHHRISFCLFGISYLDIKTQMNLLKLRSGKFLVISTCTMTPGVLRSLKTITQDGKLIEAVVANHPFHTLSFPAFRAAFPDVKMYGTPRHLRKQPELKWAGNIHDEKVRALWEPEVQMRVTDPQTAGLDFVSPIPEVSNHGASVLVYHRDSKSVIIEDTVNYNDGSASFLLRNVGGLTAGEFLFHSSILTQGLRKEAKAGSKFMSFMRAIQRDWDFENAFIGHLSNCIGGAKQRFATLIEAQAAAFEAHDKQWAHVPSASPVEESKDESHPTCVECG